MMSGPMYFLNATQPFTATTAANELPVQYPSTFFETEKKKPLLTIPANHQDIGRYTLNGLLKGNISVEIALSFIYHKVSEIKEKSVAKWESFGVVIGEEAESISITNLFCVEHTALPAQLEQNNAYDNARDDIWLLLALLAPYRLIQISNEDYRAQICARIGERLKASGKPDTFMVSLDSFHTKYASWALNVNYRKLVAGIDMFFNTFRNHAASILRMCTLPSRFKDCSALIAIGYIVDVLGIKVQDLSEWIFVEKTGREMFQLMKEHQEIDKNNSYTAYLSDMGISAKSPYSASANPNIHTWIHTIGTTFKSGRSKNARMMSNTSLTDVITNAQLLCTAFLKGAKFSKIISSDPESFLNTATEEIEGILPAGRDPDEWLIWVKENPNRLQEEVVEFITKIWTELGETRPNSVGRYLAERAGVIPPP